MESEYEVKTSYGLGRLPDNLKVVVDPCVQSLRQEMVSAVQKECFKMEIKNEQVSGRLRDKEAQL